MNEEAVIRSVVDRLRKSLRRQFPAVVEDVRFRLGSDKDGDSAVFVTVVLKDRKQGDDYNWTQLEPLEQRIRSSVLDKDPFRFPYVGFELASEYASLTAE